MQVHVDLAARPVVVLLQERADVHHARVVDEHVDRPEPVGHRGQERRERLAAGDVDRRAERSARALGQPAVEVAGRHAGAARRQRADRGQADPAPASGHSDDTSGDLTLAHRAGGYLPDLSWTGKPKDCSRAAPARRRAARAARCWTGCTPTARRSTSCAARSAEQRLALLPIDRLLSSEAALHGPRDRRAERASTSTGSRCSAARSAWPCPIPTSACTARPTSSPRGSGSQYREVGLPDEDALEAQRVLGRGMARYAEAVRTLVGQTFLQAGTDEAELGGPARSRRQDPLPLAGPWLEYVFSLHMREALRQEVVTAEQLATGQIDASRDYAVAFADLVGFTELGETDPRRGARRASPARLSRAGRGGRRAAGRIVKEIGDAVMLVCARARPARRVGAAARRGLRRRRGPAGDPRRRRLRPGRQPLGRLVRLDCQRRQPPHRARAPGVGAHDRGGARRDRRLLRLVLRRREEAQGPLGAR